MTLLKFVQYFFPKPALVFCLAMVFEVAASAAAPARAHSNQYWLPENVRVGEEQTYYWSSTNTTSCLSLNGIVRVASGSDGPNVATNPGSFIAEITCTGSGGTSQSSYAPRLVLPQAPVISGNVESIDGNYTVTVETSNP